MFGFRNMTQPAIEKLNRVRGRAPRSERIMGKPDREKKAKNTRKPHRKPTAIKLVPEQAKLKLLGYASMGDEGAKDLLEMMFPEGAREDSKSKSKSA